MLRFYSTGTAGAPELCELQPGPGRGSLGRGTREGPQTLRRSPQRSSDTRALRARGGGRSLPMPGQRHPAWPAGGGVARPKSN